MLPVSRNLGPLWTPFRRLSIRPSKGMQIMLGGLLQVGGALLGGVLGNRAQRNTNRANAKSVAAANKTNIAINDATNRTNIQLARDANRQNVRLARNSVRYRVEDARRAGINPLAAMGAPTMGGIVTSAMVQPTSVQASQDQPSYAMGDAVGSALANVTTPAMRERQALENQLLRAQINSTDAGTAATVAEARSRSVIAAARAGSMGGAIPTSNVSILPRGSRPGASASPQADAPPPGHLDTILGRMASPESIGYSPMGDVAEAYGEPWENLLGVPQGLHALWAGRRPMRPAGPSHLAAEGDAIRAVASSMADVARAAAEAARRALPDIRREYVPHRQPRLIIETR